MNIYTWDLLSWKTYVYLCYDFAQRKLESLSILKKHFHKLGFMKLIKVSQDFNDSKTFTNR